jgi:asparagine synthase (glutamine-hydrolysing)
VCGIAGILAFDNSNYQIEEKLLLHMRDTIAHRGPDGVGLWIAPDSKIALAHRRLSIIDLSAAANQPMSNADDTIFIVFNGEIYNFPELRAELQSLNYAWKTDHSDTEVVLHAYEEWGVQFVAKLRGMFAIALWDSRRRELILARDRIGIKPLYYTVQQGRLIFASEIKAILADKSVPRQVNEEAFYHYLSFLTTPAPHTMFAGINKLPAGTLMQVKSDGTTQSKRYWNVWDEVRPLIGRRDEDIAEALLHELEHAVAIHKLSDVPVGVFLSGGIDSSTNAALFSRGESRPVETFTIGYQGEYASYPNETSYARMMADHVHAAYHERLLRLDDLLEFLPRMIYLQDEPIADPVCVPVYYLCELARQHGVPVCQVGEGADELFCGYPSWLNLLKIQHMNESPVPRWAKKCGLAALRLMGHDNGFPYARLQRGIAQQPVFWGGAEAFTEVHKKRLLSPRLRRQFQSLSSWEVVRPFYEKFRSDAWEKSYLNWMSYLDLNLRLPELLLARVDKMSMGVSLEARVPFLDHKLVEFALGIPEHAKIRGGVLKYILKKAVRGVIPDTIIDRPKQGFGVPIYEWFLDRLGERTRDELGQFCTHTDFLDRAEVMRLIAAKQGQQVWYLLNFALWWKEYLQ